MDDALLKKFDTAMFEIYHRAKTEAKYPANQFLKMLTERGGWDTALSLVRSVKPSDGYTALYERGYLNLTVEAMVLENPKWHPLFTEDDLAKIKKRLADYNYTPNHRP